MALIDDTRIGEQGSPVPAEAEKPEGSSFLDTTKAAFSLYNPITSLTESVIDRYHTTQQPYDENYNPFTDLEDQYIPFADKFVNVRNEGEAWHIKNRIDYEQEQRQVIQDASTPITIAATLAAGVVDPFNMIPVLSGAAKIGTAARIAASAAAVGAIQVGEEAVLHSTLQTSTVEESMANVAIAAATGGIIGGVAGGIASKAAKETITNSVKNAYNDIAPKFTLKDNGEIHGPDSAGAMRAVRSLDDANEVAGILGNDYAKSITTLVGGGKWLNSPSLRAALSDSPTVRALGGSFYDNSLIVNKNLEGIASDVRASNLIEQRINKVLLELNDINTDFKSYLKKVKAENSPAIDLGEFSSRVTNVLENPNTVDDIAEVNKAAKTIRQGYTNALTELKANGLLGDIPEEFAASYMRRIYDVERLMTPRLRDDFQESLTKWLVDYTPDNIKREVPLDSTEALNMAKKYYDKIIGDGDASITMETIADSFVSKGGFLKERELRIPSHLLPKGAVIDDALSVYSNYMRSASKLIETTAALKRNGFDSIQDAIKQIKVERDVELSNPGVTPEKALKIHEKYDNIEAETNLMYRSMLGQLYKPGKGAKYLKNILEYNAVTSLGGMTISSLAEVTTPLFKKNFGDVVDFYFKPIFKDLFQDIKAGKINREQLADISGAVQFQVNDTMQVLRDINMPTYSRRNGAFTRLSEKMTNSFITATGIRHWSVGVRNMTTQLSSASLIRKFKNLADGKELSEFDIADLANKGIGKEDYEAIITQVQRHTEEINGTYVMNPDEWTNKVALQKFKNAIQQDVEAMLLKPNVGDIPYAIQKEPWAKLIFQFKSYSITAYHKILLNTMQRAELGGTEERASIAAGIASMVALNYMAQGIKDTISGYKDKKNNMFERSLSNNAFVPWIVGQGAMMRVGFGAEGYNLGNLLGPTAGKLNTITKIASGDEKKIQNMIPYQNLWFIKPLLNELWQKEEK